MNDAEVEVARGKLKFLFIYNDCASSKRDERCNLSTFLLHFFVFLQMTND